MVWSFVVDWDEGGRGIDVDESPFGDTGFEPEVGDAGDFPCTGVDDFLSTIPVHERERQLSIRGLQRVGRTSW